MIKWDEVQRETESMLSQVRNQVALYRKRIDELEAETAKLTATIAVARKMQEGGYTAALNSQSSLPVTPTPSEEDKSKNWQTDLVGTTPVAVASPPKPNWQRGIDALGEIPDLPPAIGLRRQPNKTNTSYRAAALLKEAARPLHVDDIIAEFDRRHWIDPTWAKPKEAITVAVKRSVTYGWTDATGKYTYVYSPRHIDED
ncbi:hypothetical protein BIU82_06580 [Arthrobacter sp. SW1]|uniref:hypothetical protein n=1 Tax=Arthrobacter sp. SW1 TaxID=1920889 RepID=UPI000877C88E|nr:hypothetical protein [Arthrobacter sp. SW1]OFI38154.1 hypothetical protein BIU82_06580 [Arthrobacter sp. SW1]